MKLLTKPLNFDYTKKREYESFGFFRLALTERNWSGEDYITKEDCEWFISALHELDKIYEHKLATLDSKCEFTLLIDTSVYSESATSHSKVLPLLEELSAYKVSRSEENSKSTSPSNKLMKKIRNFAHKPENFSIIYQWSLENEDNPFSQELSDLVLEHTKNISVRAKNEWIKELKAIALEDRKMKNKGIENKKMMERLEFLQTQTVVNCEKRDVDFLKKMMKTSVTQPKLFFISMYLFRLYFKGMEDLLSPGNEFISIERKSNDLDIFLKDSTPQLDNLFLEQETFISSLPRRPRKVNGYVDYHFSLYDLNEAFTDDNRQIKDVFLTIAKWIMNRLESSKYKISAFNKKWIHPINGDLFKEIGLTYILFEDAEFIGGLNGKELLIKTRVFIDNGEQTGDFLFPIFDPNSWANLNATQCALLTYALCLFHDIYVEDNFHFEPQTVSTMRGESFDFLLLTNTKLGNLSPLNAQSKGSETTNKKSQSTSLKTMSEHWVTFHFRKLRPNHRASERAKQSAASYGIHQLPDGFTFVDTFVRGERIESSRLRFYAIDILNKTIHKLNSYYQKQKEVLNAIK